MTDTTTTAATPAPTTVKVASKDLTHLMEAPVELVEAIAHWIGIHVESLFQHHTAKHHDAGNLDKAEGMRHAAGLIANQVVPDAAAIVSAPAVAVQKAEPETLADATQVANAAAADPAAHTSSTAEDPASGAAETETDSSGTGEPTEAAGGASTDTTTPPPSA